MLRESGETTQQTFSKYDAHKSRRGTGPFNRDVKVGQVLIAKGKRDGLQYHREKRVNSNVKE